MSVLTRIRLVANERLDIPDIKNIESFACADWAQFFDKYMANSSFIIKGFDVTSPKTLIGSDSTSGIRINIANSVMFHPTSSNAGGGFFVAPTDEEAQIVSLAAGATNYIELDQQRVSGSSDIRKIWSPSLNNNEGGEFDQVIDTVENLEVIVYANTVGFTEGRIPIAKIVTSAAPASTITSITDCRPLFFRLGTGGANPNPLNDFAWVDTPSGFARIDSPLTVDASSPAGTNPFQGADKNIRHFRDWMEAVMTRIKELGSTPYWFTKSGLINNAAMGELWWDSVGSKITGTGDYKHTAGPTFEWTSDIIIKSVIGDYEFIIPANTIGLNDDEIAYVVQERNIDLTGGIDLSWINGATYVDGSVGAFTGLAADSGVTVGDWIKKVSDGIERYVRIVEFYDQPGGAGGAGAPCAAAVALSVEVAQAYGGASISEKGVYAKGEYSLVKALRNVIANDSNVWWLAMNMKNGGGSDYFYIRGGIRLVEDEDVPISNETSVDTLDYIGAADDSDAKPDYDSYSAASIGAKAGQQSYESTNEENLTKRSSLLTSMMADKAQDKNVNIREGGDLLWTQGSGIFTATNNIIISIPSSSFNNYITPAGIAAALAITPLSNAGDCIYFVINRNSVGLEDISASLVVDTEPNVPNDENTFVLAHRGADNYLYFMDGTRLVNGETNYLGGTDFFALDTAFVTVVDDVTYPGMDGDFKLANYETFPGSGVYDATACIQAAVDSIKTEGGTIYVRTGLYVLTTAINFEGTTKELKIFGDGKSTHLRMPNIVRVSEVFVSDGDIGGVGTGTLDVANPTSLVLGDWVKVNDDDSAPNGGWVTNISVGGGVAGSDRITISEDSAGTIPMPTMGRYTVAANADITTYTGAAFIIPWKIDDISISKMYVTNGFNQSNPTIVGNSNQNISIDSMVSEVRNSSVYFFGPQEVDRCDGISVTNCTLLAYVLASTDAVEFEGWFSNIKVHDNKITCFAGGAGVHLHDSNDDTSIQGRNLSVKNNSILVNHSSGVIHSYGVKVAGHYSFPTIVDNIIEVSNSGAAGGQMRGVEFYSGKVTGQAISIISYGVIANNQIAITGNGVASDLAINIQGDMLTTNHFDYLSVIGNVCRVQDAVTINCAYFRGIAFGTVTGNVFHGGSVSSENWSTTNNSVWVVAGPNEALNEPDYTGIDRNKSFAMHHQITKGWFTAVLAAAGAVTVLASYNVSSMSWSSNDITINWVRNFSSAEYAMTFMRKSTTIAVDIVAVQNAGNVIVSAFDPDGTAGGWQSDAGAAGHRVMGTAIGDSA